MDPLSTLVLTAAFLVAAPATRRPEWEKECSHQNAEPTAPSRTSMLLLDSSANATVPATCEIIEVERQHLLSSISPKELLKREVNNYSDFGSNWDGAGGTAPSHIAIEGMLAFIDAIPSRLPLPRPMISASGEIGVYWDLMNGYAETTFDSQGVATFFSRTNQGEEQFIENLVVTNLDSPWFWSVIQPVDSVTEMAA